MANVSASNLVSVIALCALFPLDARAQDQEANEPPDEATVGVLVERISREGRVNVVVPRDLADKRVSAQLPPAWEEALYQIGDLAQAHVFEIGERTYILEPSTGRMTFDFMNVNYTTILHLAARSTDASIVVTSSPLSSSHLQLRNVSLRTLLDEISKQNKDMVVSQRGGIYRVSTGQIEKLAARNPLSDKTMAALGLGRSHPELKKSVSLKLKDAKPSDALKLVSDAVGFSIELDERLDEETIDLTLVDAPWRDALEAIAWSSGGALWDDGKGDISIRRIPRITMDCVDSGIWNVLEQIGKDSGVPIDYGQDLERHCTLNVRNVHWRDLLYAIWQNDPFQLLARSDGGLQAKPYAHQH